MSIGDLWEQDIMRSPKLRAKHGYEPMIHLSVMIPTKLREGLDKAVEKELYKDISEATRSYIRNGLREDNLLPNVTPFASTAEEGA